MKRLIFLLNIFIASSCSVGVAPGLGPQPCSAQWQENIEKELQTSDSEGHGPDIGSLEWRSVVEFKLDIRGDPATPSRESDEWCTYVEQKIHKSGD